jgi:hypothetical protein
MKLEILKKLKGKMPAPQSKDSMLDSSDLEGQPETAPNEELANISDEDLIKECKSRGIKVEDKAPETQGEAPITAGGGGEQMEY